MQASSCLYECLMLTKTINENTLQDPVLGTILNFPAVEHSCAHMHTLFYGLFILLLS